MVIEEEEDKAAIKPLKSLLYFMCISICAWCQGGQKKTDTLKLEYRWL